MTSSLIQPVLSLLQKPEDTERAEIEKQVDADIAAASTPSKEDEEIARQVDADIAAAQKPPEELDVFGEKKDPLTKGIEYVQSGIEGMIQSGEEDYPIVNELSKRLQEAGPNKFDEYDKDIVSTLNPKEVKKLLDRQPWVYATLTPEQKAEQFKQSRESDISTLGAVGRAVGQVANFGLDLVKAGANYGWDQTYAEGIAPLIDVYNDQMPRDPITGKIKSLTGGPAQKKARERVSADFRNMAGAWANTIIESQRQIERFSGGTGEGYKFLTPSPQKISESVAKSPQAASAVAMFPMLGPAAAFSPLFLSTKMAEAGKDPNSGYAAFIDQINEKLGLQDESMSQKHFDNRKLYDAEKSAEDWNAGQGAELVSPWSKMAFSPAFQYLNLQRNAWMLPNAETYAKLKNISVEQAKDELARIADENSEKGLRSLADKLNKEYDPSMELLGGMAMGDAALDVAGIAVGGTRLLGKGISKLETAGMTPAQINALMTARQARQKEILAQNIANAQKRSAIGGAAKKIEDVQKAASEKVSQTFEKLPTVVKEYGPGVLSQIGLGTAGGTAGYFLNPEDQVSGALKGLTLTGAVGLTPGLLRSIDEARMLRAGGSPLGAGTFEIAGKLPTSSKTTKVLFGGKRGAAVDYLTDNLHTLGRAGVNFGAINAINSAINSDDPEKFVDSVAEGIAMGVGFKMLGKIHGSDPEEELSNRKRKDVEIYLSRQRQSDATQKNMDELRNYQNYVDASQMNVDKMQGFLAQAEQEGDPQKIASAQKAVDVAQSVHNQILTANVQTRNEMGRMMDEIYSDANSLLNGARKVGQQNVKLEVLTTPQIVELLSKQFPEKSADELVFTAMQRGFFIKETNTSVVNFDRIIRRQQMTGESLTDSFRHEALGHGLWSIKEFRDLNKNADDLLFEQVIRDLRGDVVDVKPGKYTEDELFDMYSTHYLKGKSKEQINQYAQESGLWNKETNSLDRAKVIDAMKDEIRAELIAGNLEQGFGKMKQQSRSIDDWVSLRAKTNFLARAMQNAAGIGAKPFESKLLGISYDPEVVAANRRAIEAMRNYNGEFEDAPETKKSKEILEKTMRNDPAMRKRYGLGGEYKTTLYAEVKDADGNVIGQKVPVTSENAKEGTWVNNTQTGQTKQTKGYGKVPVELDQVQIPDGGSLNIVSDFVYEQDGETPVRRKDKELEKLDEDRRVALKNAIDSASDRYSDPRWIKSYSADQESYDGLFSPEQIKNIKNLPESVLPLSIKEKIIALNQIMLMGDGSTLEIDYAPRLKGKKYKGRRSEIYSLIPGGKFHLSKANNFTFNAVSRGAWLRKIKARKDRMPGWFNAWGNDTGLFERELQEKYLANTYAKRPGWYGLDPENPTEKTPLAEEKWNKFKDFLNMVAKDIPTVENPWRMKTPAAKGRQGKAEGDVDNLWRAFRLDAIADWADSTDATGRYTMGWDNIYKQLMPIDEAGEPTEFRTPEQQRSGGISARFMPERMETEAPKQENDNRKNIGISFMPAREEDYAYRGEHKAPNEENGSPLHEVTRGVYPPDFYTLSFDKALQYYGSGDDISDRESLSAILSAKGKANAKVKVYRAVPKYIGEVDPAKSKEIEDRIEKYSKLVRQNPWSEDFQKQLDQALSERPQQITAINAGDWVTPSRSYAVEHGESALNGEYRILSKSIPASHLFTEGNSLSEFGYNPPVEKGVQFMPERPAEQERIVSATYTDPRTGEVREGVNHKAANPNAPDEQTDRESRYYGFKTDAGRVVDREEAYRIAEASGQLKEATSEEDRFNADRGVLHSNMVEMEPTIGEKTEISPKIDADYMKAVESGDVEAQQKLVDEAAKTTMPESMVIEPITSSKEKISDKPLLKVFHGTNIEFNKFERGRIGVTDYGFLGIVESERHGIFFAENKDFAKTFSKSKNGNRIVTAFLDIKNPFNFYDAQDIVESRNLGDEFTDDFNKAKWFLSIQDKWEAFDGDQGKDFVKWLESKGYDGAFISERGIGLEGEPDQNVWVALSPNQIKSADPVTYNDAGNVIPLSQRFNPKTSDIRFMPERKEEDTIKPADLQTSAKPEADAVIKPFSNALVSSTGLINFLPAYHGTPHEVDKFKLANIGTGEGAQAYGWGLYFAQARKVGEEYSRVVGKKGGWTGTLNAEQGKIPDELWSRLEAAYLNRGKDAVKYLAEKERDKNSLSDYYDDLTRIAFDEPLEPTGNLYKVDLDVKDEDLLDWDKPLSEQPESVRDAITALIKERIPKEIADAQLNKLKTRGGSLYALISDSFGESAQGTPEKRASEALLAAGIPGIRYLDGNSRNISGGEIVGVWQGDQTRMQDTGSGKWFARVKVFNRGGKRFADPTDSFTTSKPFETEVEAKKWAEDSINSGTYNYVVFDENLITILDKNDKPVAGELPKQTPLAKGENFEVSKSGDVFVDDITKPVKFTKDIGLQFMPARPEVNLEDYIDKPIIALTADRMGIGKAYVGPKGAEQEVSQESQGGPGFSFLYTDEQSNPVWGFTRKEDADRFVGRVTSVAKKEKSDSVLVAPTLLSPDNHLHNPTGQLGYATAIDAAIKANMLDSKLADSHIEQIMQRIAGGKALPKADKDKFSAIKSLAEFTNAVKAKEINFRQAALIREKASAKTLPISVDDMTRMGILPSEVAKNLSHEGFYELPTFSVVSLFEVPANSKPEQGGYHYAYPWIVRGKAIGFLKNIYNLDKLTSATNVRSKTTGELSAQPVMVAMPQLDPQKIQEAANVLQNLNKPTKK